MPISAKVKAEILSLKGWLIISAFLLILVPQLVIFIGVGVTGVQEKTPWVGDITVNRWAAALFGVLIAGSTLFCATWLLLMGMKVVIPGMLTTDEAVQKRVQGAILIVEYIYVIASSVGHTLFLFPWVWVGVTMAVRMGRVVESDDIVQLIMPWTVADVIHCSLICCGSIALVAFYSSRLHAYIGGFSAISFKSLASYT